MQIGVYRPDFQDIFGKVGKFDVIAAPFLLNEGSEETEVKDLSSIALIEGFPGRDLLPKCQSSRGHLSELSIKGSSEAPVTTITGEDLKTLNEDPDLLFTLTSFSVFLAPNISAEDVTSFLLGLEPLANLQALDLSVSLNDDQLLKILDRHTALKKLKLWNTESLTGKAFSALAERGSQFEELIISETSNIIEDRINSLFSSLKEVQLFYFTGRASIDATHVDALFLHSRKLTICNLSRLKPAAVQKIKQKMIEVGDSQSKGWTLSPDSFYMSTL